ncbi:hypothetical protein GCM10023086_75650 [Streptomyces venetus]|uniref:Uncharacterized protein n=1 Tax=Streptomyces venetus TaxID=1701086 RepID=A0ABP8HJZ8_9ACTN
MAQPGLAVVDVADDQTAFAIQETLAGRWATAPADRTTRELGEPGVRLRSHLHLTPRRARRDRNVRAADLRGLMTPR